MHGLTLTHLRLFLGLLIPFSALYGWIASHATNADAGSVCLAIASTVTGPFAGCHSFAWQVLPYMGGLLTLCIAWQFLPSARGSPSNRLAFWVVGWCCWLASGVLSLANAAS